jgi:DNA topoisomerase-2
MNTSRKSKTNQTLTNEEQELTEKYMKMDQREHIEKLPDTYIGSVQEEVRQLWIYNCLTEYMEYKEIKFVPGFIKIFDEILVNASDHKQRDQSLKYIKVNIEPNFGYISIQNDGEGIDIDIHPEHQIYIPEMLFGDLLTSTNYRQDEKRTTGGKNGYGAKLTNIFSKEFEIETIDSKRKLKFKQTYQNNMKEKSKPSITKCSTKPYTKIRFLPDYQKLGLSNGITDDIMGLLQKRVYDLTAITSEDVIVYLNEIKLKIKTFDKYIDLYKPLDNSDFYKFIQSEEQERWNVGIVLSPNREYMDMSFVNGICTSKGGSHINHVLSQITDKLKELLSKNSKTKTKTFKPSQIKENIWLFVNCIIENPTFTSQTKEEMTTKLSQFGSRWVCDEKMIEKFFKSGFVERLMENHLDNEEKSLKKTDGNKKQTLIIPKLDDANFAGTKRSKECTLILTEGDSAKTSALSGLSVMGSSFRDIYGVFPMKGKILNVRDANASSILNNAEIKNIKLILGLQQGKEYTIHNLHELRYGSVVIFCDQDVDGSHIKGLIINFFHHFFPSLLKIDGFIKTYITPIVRGFKGKQSVNFYTINDYETFKLENKGFEYKYYKGLGTSSSKEMQEYFKKMNEITIIYHCDEKTDSNMEMTFRKTKSNERKEWLKTYNPNDTLIYSVNKELNGKVVCMDDFIHKDFKHFSNYDNIRSIPNLYDGLKPSQRKVLYASLKKFGKENKEMKVAQLAGFISEHTCYHHGEKSLEETIVGMAQNFVGKNNINLLNPNGQFGTRLEGGHDHASARYIFTNINPITHSIFNKDDNNLLEYNDDDGYQIEPKVYYPILPMILINGCEGIGTGYSTSIPCFSVQEIIEECVNYINYNQIKDDWVPYYNGFKGTITPYNPKTSNLLDEINELNETSDNHSSSTSNTTNHLHFITKGIYEIKLIKDTYTIIITELPIGMWTNTYKEFIEEQILLNQEFKKSQKSETTETSKSKSKTIRLPINSYLNRCTDELIHFEITFDKGFNPNQYDIDTLLSKLKLTSKISLTNMYLYKNGEICKYHSVKSILQDYIIGRLELYEKRRLYLIEKYTNDLLYIDNKIRFLEMIMNDELIIYRKKKEIIIKELEELKFDKKDNDYNYLIKIPIDSFTEDNLEKLYNEKQSVLDNKMYYEENTNTTLYNVDIENLVNLID